MDVKVHEQLPIHRQRTVLLVLVALVLVHGVAAAQGLTGALIGTVKDEQGGVLAGAAVRLDSPALIGGPATLTTNEKGQLRFPALPPGVYVLDITTPRFATLHEEDIRIGAGATLERTVVLQSLLDLRVSRVIAIGRVGRVELLVDVLNTLNETAEEELATDNFFSPNLGQPSRFVDPRRAMVGLRLNFGR